MRKRDSVPALLALLAIGLFLTFHSAPDGTGRVNAQENQRRTGFDSPRLGVVDIQAVMESYARTKNILKKLAAEEEAINTRVKKLESQYREALDELELLRDPKPEADVLKAYGLKLKLQNVQQFDVPALRQQRAKSIQSIEQDVLREIEAAREALELDVVLSRGLRLRFGEEGTMSVPIVLSHSPEFDLTKEVSLRLNTAYRK